ncbi:hypothetical protein D3C81_1099070 [compost metagenome]
MYNQHISQLCLRRKMMACSENDERALVRSFMPNQAAIAAMAMAGTQMKPAFCRNNWPPPSTSGCGAPPIAPNTPTVMTKGTTSCDTDTPTLPSPAFSPNAMPWRCLG